MADATSASFETLTEFKDSRHLVLAPAVGYYSQWPKTGTLLTGGSFAGQLKVLNTYYDLYLPEDVYGRVTVENNKDLVTPVEYGAELFQLNPEKGVIEPGKEKNKTAAESKSKKIDISSEEGYVVTAFTTGIFYAKPSPDAPTFVTVGQEIEKGKALGLIEVMKTFNHIIFQGTEDSDTGKIKKIYVKDSQEVKVGEPLFLIE